ncbi:uncharacterized protein LOC102807676 [Saccoglossus kowalevskii]|uniref:Serine/arginine repetitive matrix protein 4-like n=1 Tax=Saccoglossus kowalevskii TaxID=10224 RepID=A0ABM0LXS8_SACKO|nr:PREDICTED: serine/arginine repetitive matrix protein 4-like [Saccoglossus kowalevskii]
MSLKLRMNLITSSSRWEPSSAVRCITGSLMVCGIIGILIGSLMIVLSFLESDHPQLQSSYRLAGIIILGTSPLLILASFSIFYIARAIKRPKRKRETRARMHFALGTDPSPKKKKNKKRKHKRSKDKGPSFKPLLSKWQDQIHPHKEINKEAKENKQKEEQRKQQQEKKIEQYELQEQPSQQDHHNTQQHNYNQDTISDSKLPHSHQPKESAPSQNLSQEDAARILNKRGHASKINNRKINEQIELAMKEATSTSRGRARLLQLPLLSNQDEAGQAHTAGQQKQTMQSNSSPSVDIRNSNQRGDISYSSASSVTNEVPEIRKPDAPPSPRDPKRKVRNKPVPPPRQGSSAKHEPESNCVAVNNNDSRCTCYLMKKKQHISPPDVGYNSNHSEQPTPMTSTPVAPQLITSRVAVSQISSNAPQGATFFPPDVRGHMTSPPREYDVYSLYDVAPRREGRIIKDQYSTSFRTPDRRFEDELFLNKSEFTNNVHVISAELHPVPSWKKQKTSMKNADDGFNLFSKDTVNITPNMNIDDTQFPSLGSPESEVRGSRAVQRQEASHTLPQTSKVRSHLKYGVKVLPETINITRKDKNKKMIHLSEAAYNKVPLHQNSSAPCQRSSVKREPMKLELVETDIGGPLVMGIDIGNEQLYADQQKKAISSWVMQSCRRNLSASSEELTTSSTQDDKDAGYSSGSLRQDMYRLLSSPSSDDWENNRFPELQGRTTNQVFSPIRTEEPVTGISNAGADCTSTDENAEETVVAVPRRKRSRPLSWHQRYSYHSDSKSGTSRRPSSVHSDCSTFTSVTRNSQSSSGSLFSNNGVLSTVSSPRSSLCITSDADLFDDVTDDERYTYV